MGRAEDNLWPRAPAIHYITDSNPVLKPAEVALSTLIVLTKITSKEEELGIL